MNYEYSAGIKRYNDKLTIYKYVHPPENKFRQFSETHKVNTETGELIKYQWSDFKKRSKSDAVSLARARSKVIELSEKNSFDYFLTITFNKKFVDRSNALEVHKTFKNIIKRFKYHYENIDYVSVPEFHKDNENIHYHLMINFAVKPKLRFYKKSKRGAPLFHIIDEFKKYDCFLVISPLENNNTKYLIKYLTKAHAFPLYRKYSCTRKLNRSRLINKHCVVIDAFNWFDTYSWTMEDWFIECRNDKCKVFVLTPAGVRGGFSPPAPGADLSYNNTKDEIISEKWKELLNIVGQFQKIEKNVFDSGQKQENNENSVKLQTEQLTFGI